MAKITILSFVKFPGVKFFLCHVCLTHIASVRKLVCRTHFANEPEKGIFEETINLVIKSEEHHYNRGNNIMANAYCPICKDHVGAKYIKGETFAGQKNIQKREGRTEVFMEKLLFWDGTRMLNAVSMLPLVM